MSCPKAPSVLEYRHKGQDYKNSQQQQVHLNALAYSKEGEMTEDKKQGKMLMLVIGVVLIALALLADRIGLGAVEGFGWKQIALLIVGIGLLAAKAKCCGSCEKK